jgi:hypothetical protein
MMHACVHACTEPLRHQAFALPTHALIGGTLWTLACSPRRSKQKSARFTWPNRAEHELACARMKSVCRCRHACAGGAGQGRAGAAGALGPPTSRDEGGGVELGKLTVVVTVRFCSQVRKQENKVRSTQWQAKIFLKRTQEKAFNFGISEIRKCFTCHQSSGFRGVTTIVLRRYAMIQRDTRVVVASKREDGYLMSAWGP